MRALTAVALLTGLVWCEPLLAGDYVVEIGGADGATFGGTCLLISPDRTESRKASGTVPLTFELSADGISCAIQKKSGAGDLSLVIRGADGHVVARSSEVQPFGIVMAAGR
jgi:hypothetical protein